MKKIFTLFVLGAIAVTAGAQETTSKFSISAFGAPTLTRRIMSGTHPVIPEFKELLNELEKPKLGYAAGVLVSYHAGKNISIQTGVSFTNNGYLKKKEKLRYEYQFDGTGFNPNIPVRDGDPTDLKVIDHFYYIDLPVYAKYTFLNKKKIELYAVAGVEANFNVSNKTTVVLWYKDKKERETQEIETQGTEFRKVNCSVALGVGIDIALSESVSIFVQPTYRQMLLDMLKDVPVKRRLYSAGLVTGVSIHI